MKNQISIFMLLVGVEVNGANSGAQSLRYVVDTRDVQGDPSNKIVSLRDKRQNRIIWTRQLYGPQVTWSKDRRAVTVEGVWHILVWQEGYQLRDLGVPGRRDYSMGCLWSPDKQRLLIRCGSSAASDFNAGSLFCLKWGRGKSYKYSFVAGDVRAMKWHGNRTILYWPLDVQTGATPKKPRIWRVP